MIDYVFDCKFFLLKFSCIFCFIGCDIVEVFEKGICENIFVFFLDKLVVI